MDVKASWQNAVSYHADAISKLYSFKTVMDEYPELTLRAGWVDFDPHGKLRIVLFTENTTRDNKLFRSLTRDGFHAHGENLVGEGEDYILTLAPLSETVGASVAEQAQGAANGR